MSRIKLLLDVVEDLNALASDLKRMVDAMSGDEPANEPETVTPEPEKVVTVREVRAVLSEKVAEEVRALLEAFGAKKLSEIPEDRYGALLEQALLLTDKEAC